MVLYLHRLEKVPCRINFLKKIFHKNGYPENFIDKCFKKFLDNIHLVKEKVPAVERKLLLLVLLDVGYLCKLELNYNKQLPLPSIFRVL